MGRREPLRTFAEPHRTRIRQAARALAEALADAVSGDGPHQRGLSVDAVERAILAQCAPAVRTGVPDDGNA